MKALILAGGEGTRLRPLTTNWPKPMLPIANKPMLQHVIFLLKRHGFEEIIITVAYMASTIRNYFEDGSEFGVRIKYATEEHPLGTAGSVYNAKDELDETFLVISGDVLTDVDLTELVRFHYEKNAIVSIGLSKRENPVEFGIVICDENQRVEKFLEKPTWGQVFSDRVNTGIYVLDPDVFNYIEEGVVTDFSQDVFPRILEKDGRIYGSVLNGYWEDVGTLEAYLEAQKDALSNKVKLNIEGFEINPGTFVSNQAQIDPEAELIGHVLIGQYSNVKKQAKIGPDTVLGANVRVGEGASIERSLILDNCYIGPNTTIRSAIIGNSCDIRNGVFIDEGVVLGDKVEVGPNSSIEGGVKIYPHKVVEPFATVNKSIVWETKATKSLFSQEGITGLANVDITPELGVRLGLTWGSMLPKGSKVVASRDSSRAARLLKRAIMAGLNAAGVTVEDLEVSTAGAARFLVRSSDAMGGFAVKLKQGDPNTLVIKFFDSYGIDLDEQFERKLERTFYREEYRRALAGDVGDINFPGRTPEQFGEEILRHVNLDSIRRARFKFVLNYCFGTASFIMNNLLSKLNADVLAYNPFGSTIQAMSTDLYSEASKVAELVRSSRADFGLTIDKDAERLVIVDDNGTVLTDEQSLLLFAKLLSLAKTDSSIAVPISMTHKLEQVALNSNVNVYRTKVSASNLMEVATAYSVDICAFGSNKFSVPQVLPAFDACISFMAFLDLFAKANCSLSSIVGQLPTARVCHDEVVTSWHFKGSLMRELVEKPMDVKEVELIDGVKYVFDCGWGLIIPDASLAITHIWAEHEDAGKSEELLGVVKDFVSETLRRL